MLQFIVMIILSVCAYGICARGRQGSRVVPPLLGRKSGERRQGLRDRLEIMRFSIILLLPSSRGIIVSCCGGYSVGCSVKFVGQG